MKHIAHNRAYGPARGTRLPAAGTSDQAKSKAARMSDRLSSQAFSLLSEKSSPVIGEY